MNASEAQSLLNDLFRELLDPDVPPERLASRLTADYRQVADGKTLELAGFVDHARALKSVVAEAEVRFETHLADGDRVASLHVVTERKRDGT